MRVEKKDRIVVTKHLEQLCEKEFALKQDDTYKGFDQGAAWTRRSCSVVPLAREKGRPLAAPEANR
jgi:hypothetical protein